MHTHTEKNTFEPDRKIYIGLPCLLYVTFHENDMTKNDQTNLNKWTPTFLQIFKANWDNV